MKNWIAILSGLLIVQVILALLLIQSGEEYGAFEAEEKLLTFDENAVDGLRIEDDKTSVVLEKRNGSWLLPEKKAFPANQGSVKQLLDRLAGIEKGWPVATTSGAASRFKVDEDAFERKLTLSKGGEKLAELYIGSSPGFRKTHVRRPDDNTVFAVEFNKWEAGTKHDDWIDKRILKLDENKIVRVEMPGYSLHQEGDNLQVADISENEEPIKEEISSLIRKLAGLRIDGLLGTDIKPEYRQDSPELVVKLEQKKDEALTYNFSKPEKEAYYVLKRSDQEHYFKIAEHNLKPIKETTREKLVRTKTVEERAEPAKKESKETEPEEQDKL